MAILSSLSLDLDKDDLPSLAQKLGQSFQNTGFAIIDNHGIDTQLIERAETLSRQFFALPEDVKHRYHIGNGGARGYTPFGTEKAKDSDKVDLKEFWHIGRDLPEGHVFQDYMPANIWPAEIDEFRAVFLELFAAFDKCGLRILRAIALYLRIDMDYFADTVRDGNSVLRLLHYPPVPANSPSVRAAAHEDINTITLLLGAQEAGLELLDRDGNWQRVKPKDGQLVVNIGDMLQRLTNNILPSTTHRVVNPSPMRASHARYSMPYFLHFRPDFMIETLENCKADGIDHYPDPISAHDYLLQRLKEINLI